MEYQRVFKRYELKYRMTVEQAQKLLEAMRPYMCPDRFGHSTVRNVYYDTDSYRLIRHSLEKPVYKEKLRLRSYTPISPQDKVFVELKKKYRSVVYKRRLTLPEGAAVGWLGGGEYPGTPSQIADEIGYFRDYYETLHPVVYLSYERDAFAAVDGSDLRITFDGNIRARQDRLSLCEEPGGVLLLPTDEVLMEVKTAGAIPLWLAHALDSMELRKTSFSKYGAAYMQFIRASVKSEKGDFQYAD